MNRRFSFSRSLTLHLTVLVVVPICLLGLALQAYMTQRIDEEITARNTLLAQVVRGEMAGFLRQPENFLTFLLGAVQEGGGLTRGDLYRAARISRFFESIYLLDDQGIVTNVGFASGDGSEGRQFIGLDLSGQPFYQQTRGRSETYWSNAYTSTLTGETALTVAIPYVKGLIVGSFHLKRLDEIAAKAEAGGGVEVMVADKRGVLIRGPDATLSNQQLNVSNLSVVQLGLEGKEGARRYEFEGRARLGSVMVIPGTGLLLVLSQDLSTALAPVFGLRVTLIAGLAVSALLAGLFALWNTKKVVRPLARLGENVRRIASGAYELAEDGEHYAFPEFDRLAWDVSAMAGTIQTREKELKESEERVASLLMSTGEGICGMDIQGVCTLCNPAALALLGYREPEQLLGRNLHQAIHYARADGSPYPAEECRASRAFFNGEAAHVDDEVFWRADGTSFPVEYRAHPLFKEGEVIGGVVSFTDITERKRAEDRAAAFNRDLEQRVAERTRDLEESLAALKKAQGQLVESERLASLGGLVAGVAHEINTPVGVGYTAASLLEGRTQEILEKSRDGAIKRSDFEAYLDTASESTGMILSNLDRAVRLIRSFKQVAVDQSSEERRLFNVKEYADGVLQSLQPKLKRTRHMVTVSCPDDVEIFSYPGAFSQIITNLVMNSLQHGFQEIEQGRIQLEFSREKGGRLLFLYRDNGRGMQATQAERIFDPFFTTSRASGGSGLGMHVVYNLATGPLNGEITCQSAPGEGIEIRIALPGGTDA